MVVSGKVYPSDITKVTDREYMLISFLTGLLPAFRWFPPPFFRLGHFLSQYLKFWLLNDFSSHSSSEAKLAPIHHFVSQPGSGNKDSLVSHPSLILNLGFSAYCVLTKCMVWNLTGTVERALVYRDNKFMLEKFSQLCIIAVGSLKCHNLNIVFRLKMKKHERELTCRAPKCPF